MSEAVAEKIKNVVVSKWYWVVIAVLFMVGLYFMAKRIWDLSHSEEEAK